MLTRKNKKIRLSRRVRSCCRKLIQGSVRLLLSCGTVFVLLLLMFLLAKGPAYISFHAEQTEQSSLSGLYSRCVYLQADRIAADICESSYLGTKIAGGAIELSSDALDNWLSEYLGQAGIVNASDPRLRIEGDPSWEMELTYKAADATVRYMIEDSDAAYIDPDQSAAFRCSFRQAQILPRVTSGEAFESYIALYDEITVNIPADPGIRCYVVYNDGMGMAASSAINADMLPGYQSISAGQRWTFSLQDTSLQVRSGGKTPLRLETCGQYRLKLSCIGAGQIRGYLTGELLFQNTNTPKKYTLAGQLVDIGSRNKALNVILCTGTGHELRTKDELLISGEANEMDIAGVNPFPDMRMWFRENIYMAPVSLLSVMISMYGLSKNKGSTKVKPRRIR